MLETTRNTLVSAFIIIVLFLALTPTENKIPEETHTVQCEVYKRDTEDTTLVFARDGLEVYTFHDDGKQYSIGDNIICTIASYEEGTYDDYVKEVKEVKL